MEMRKNAQGALDHQVLNMALEVQRDLLFLRSHGVYNVNESSISIEPEMFRRMFPALSAPRRVSLDPHTYVMDAVYHGQRIASYIYGV